MERESLKVIKKMQNHKSALIAIVVLLTVLLAGCSPGGSGIPQEQYDSLKTQLEVAQAQVAELQGEIGDMQEQRDSAGVEFEAAQEKIDELQSQISGLQEQYELVGATPAETAENIVRRYHETHTYSIQDFFVCSDMAADVWNMLQAQGIEALIQIGNVETGVADIVNSDHAWVLAEVSPGNYLALEATGGRVIPQSENALYYQGWSFTSPKDLKRYKELKREWNVRVEIINQLQAAAKEAQDQWNQEINKYNEMVDEFNSKYVGQPVSTESKVFEARLEAQSALLEEKENSYNQLQDLIGKQEAKMHGITSEISGLAKER
ncbi:hypothetical protein ACFLXD_07025 [Chloroflexota bacterium]